MIIDVHGHYTTAPAALGAWRDRQIAALKERRHDLTIFCPRASFMAHHIGDLQTSRAWAAICNELCFRVARMFPGHFVAAAVLPQSPEPLAKAGLRYID
jgi:4-oxalmesaconate hydratase